MYVNLTFLTIYLFQKIISGCWIQRVCQWDI